MSSSAICWAMRQKCGGPRAKLILMLLADNGSPDVDVCECCIQWLSSKAEMPAQTVKQTINQLVNIGRLEARFHPSGNGVVIYSMPLVSRDML